MSTLRIDTNGNLLFVYNDRLQNLMSEGSSSIRRASHVEPTADGRWTADLTPVNGPTLGPFDSRGEALKEEVKWLEENYITA